MATVDQDAAELKREIEAIKTAQRLTAESTKISAIPFSYTYSSLPPTIVLTFTPDNAANVDYFIRADINQSGNVFSVEMPKYSRNGSVTRLEFPALGMGVTPLTVSGIAYVSVTGSVVVS